MIMERLFTKAYFDLPIYSNDLGARRDFGIIERDVAAAYPDRRYIPIQTSDVRFDDSTCGRIHACATERLILWALKPSTSKIQCGMQYLGCPLIRPITAIFDAGANTALLALRVCSLNFNHNTTLLANETGRAYVRMLLSLLAVLSVIDLWRGPSPIFHNTFSWVYKIENNTDGSEITLVDQRKAHFLKEKCGWQHVADEALRAAAPRNDIFHQGQVRNISDGIRIEYFPDEELEYPALIASWMKKVIDRVVHTHNTITTYYHLEEEGIANER